jgi:hypothetical protein
MRLGYSILSAAAIYRITDATITANTKLTKPILGITSNTIRRTNLRNNFSTSLEDS